MPTLMCLRYKHEKLCFVLNKQYCLKNKLISCCNMLLSIIILLMDFNLNIIPCTYCRYVHVPWRDAKEVLKRFHLNRPTIGFC